MNESNWTDVPTQPSHLDAHHILLDGKHFHVFETDEENELVTALYAFCGFASVVFNLNMVLVYLRFPKAKRQVSPALMVLFMLCMLKGVANGVFLNILLNALYTVPPWLCVLSQLMIRFCNDYVLLLIPILAIERYMAIVYPYLSQKKLEKYSCISCAVSVAVVCLTGLFPYATFLPNSDYYDLKLLQLDAELKYHEAISCDGKLNSFPYTPVVELVLQCCCVITVIAVYLRMLFIAKERFNKVSSVTTARKMRIRRAAISVFIVSNMFLVLTLPEGILLQISSLCDNARLHVSGCAPLTNSLLHAFSIVSTSASFVVPLIFTILSPKLCRCIILFYSLLGKKVIASVTPSKLP